MTPTQIMEAEHRLIEAVVNALDLAAANLEKGQPPDREMLAKAIDFLRLYADKLHHGKEEKLFFPKLVERGVPPQGCPIGGLTHEHEKGRAFVQTLDECVTASPRNEPWPPFNLLPTLRALVDLYKNHIWKEDAMVFPMSNKFLTEADQVELRQKFAAVDMEIGQPTIARLEQFAKDLASSTVGRADPTPVSPSGRAYDSNQTRL
jgi:hemerythrin-like domain-containing protein